MSGIISQQYIQWISSTIPDFVYGGIPKKGVEDAVAPLILKEIEGYTSVASLDLTKAFDYAHPELVTRLLVYQGMARKLHFSYSICCVIREDSLK